MESCDSYLPGLWEEPDSYLMPALHQALLHPGTFDKYFCMSLPPHTVGQNKLLKPIHAMHEQNTCFLVGPVCLCSQRTARYPYGEVAMACTSSLYTLQVMSAQYRPTQNFILTKSLSVALSLYHLIKSPIIGFCRQS